MVREGEALHKIWDVMKVWFRQSAQLNVRDFASF